MAKKTSASRRPPTRRGGGRWVFPTVVTLVVLAGAIAVAVVAATGDSGSPADAIEIAAEVRIDGTTLPGYDDTGSDSAIGMSAPSMSGVDFTGKNVAAGGTTGEPYALIFLAHWCPHCQAEVPRLVSLASGRRIEGVDVVGIATSTSSAQPNYPPSEWLADEDWKFRVLVDDAEHTAANAYGLTGFPFMVFVDADGEVAGRLSGEVSVDDLRTVFRALASGSALPLPGAGPSSDG